MKMKQTEWQRLFALLLAAILVLSLCPAVFAADDEGDAAAETGEKAAAEEAEIRWVTVHITTAEELAELSRSCALDTWSQDKIVELDADISLSGTDFTPIPSFGGIFHGNGHTVSGFTLSGKLSTAGLFRTVQEGGKIDGLHVSGSLDMSGACEAAGGIAGENYGRITGCSFSGSVSGSVNTGGIAGLNGLTGAVQNCRASGAVYGSKMTGGIAGCSKGLISGCTNAAYVNTASGDETFSAEDISLDLSFDLSRLSKTEAPVSAADTGGVAGYSSGVVRSCTNDAVIGYPHVGYNVGGIVGRSCGYLHACKNTGGIHGRKDVGGIVGQAEPYIEADLSEGMLVKMQRQLDELNELVNKAVDDAQGGAGGVSSRLNSMSGYVQNAISEAEDINVVIGADGSVSVSGGTEGSASISVAPPGSADAGGSVSGGGEASGSVQVIATPDLGGLTAAVNGIGSQLSQLNRAMSGAVGQVSEDVRAINEKYNELTNTMFEAIFTVGEADGDILRDTSGVDVELITLGKLSRAENRGAVSGDLNVGGIAGSVSIEYELDPEDDVSSDLSAEYKQEYELKAVIQNCANHGTVTAKRSYAGGIAGKTDLGLITDSNGFGDVESESGSYVGGIVGLAGATVRSCFAKGTLRGSRYVGGIVGSGVSEALNQSVSTVTGCYSMVDIASAQQYFGAISGAIAGEYLENFFVSDTLAGIDGVSYGGKAEPVSYSELLTVDDLPAEMQTLTLRFTDGEKTLREITFDYGASFGDSDYPDIPEMDGCYAYWDKTDLTKLHFDTTVTAVYEPYITTLAAENTREDGKPVFYVEGSYDDDTEPPTAVARQLSAAGFAPLSAGLSQAVEHYLTDNVWYTWLTAPLNREVVEQWNVTVPSDGHEAHRVHYLSPERLRGKSPRLHPAERRVGSAGKRGFRQLSGVLAARGRE